MAKQKTKEDIIKETLSRVGSGISWLWKKMNVKYPEITYPTFYAHLKRFPSKSVTDEHLDHCISILKKEGLIK